MDYQNELVSLPEWTQVARVSIRLLLAALLGGVLGYDRQREGKAAGLRTYMLVGVGSALFTITPLEAGVPLADISRVWQGIATGIGFVGAGTILKLPQQQKIEGLTTAAGIWLTAGVGIAIGAGLLWLSIIGVVLALIIMSILVSAESRIDRNRKEE